MSAAPISAIKQRGRPFPKGKSGNPSGKPLGTRNRTTIAAQQLLDGEAESLTRTCIKMALAGDSTAMRLCMERISPAPKDRAINLPIAALPTAIGVVEALSKVIEAVGAGLLTPAEGSILSSLLETQRRCVETVTLDARISALEAAQAKHGHGRAA